MNLVTLGNLLLGLVVVLEFGSTVSQHPKQLVDTPFERHRQTGGEIKPTSKDLPLPVIFVYASDVNPRQGGHQCTLK